ncbi:nucleoside triphosphate hydrolase [Flavimaricola marinus]|uniref:Pantothenate kinase n=1 Tax=Flavimaricola marinus TaxID=1819565 RepID=A0A238LJH5_9RHOB|nr:nucleoside triphosphate hydrolase [Flavimaricola marinus]SMY09545.1 Pantothenate kinase [Flavimaricola marinus]
MLNITAHVNAVAELVHEKRADQDRLLVAIAGAPGSGKSTLADEVAKRLRLQKCLAQVVPMDGFHLDNSILEDRGLRGRKGAPETFDAHGFIHAMQRIKHGGEVILPSFDRQRDIAIAGSVSVPSECQVVLVEGNYLLFDEEPWRRLFTLWDITVMLEVPMPEIRARLIQRWLSHGLSRAAATRRAESNDIPNAQRVVARAVPADLALQIGQSA